MRILVAEDDRVSRLLLETHLKRWGHEPVSAADGTEAWEMLQKDDAPALAIPRIAELEQALARVDTLHGILPICSYCKKVRNDSNAWQQVESYVSAHSAVRFNHGVCPECQHNVVQPELEELRRARGSKS